MRASSLDRTPLADLYRKAAKMMEDYDGFSFGCCDALIESCDVSKGLPVECYCKQARTGFHGIYRDEALKNTGYYFGEFTEENRDARVIALCFMAAMAEAGDV